MACFPVCNPYNLFQTTERQRNKEGGGVAAAFFAFFVFFLIKALFNVLYPAGDTVIYSPVEHIYIFIKTALMMLQQRGHLHRTADVDPHRIQEPDNEPLNPWALCNLTLQGSVSGAAYLPMPFPWQRSIKDFWGNLTVTVS